MSTVTFTTALPVARARNVAGRSINPAGSLLVVVLESDGPVIRVLVLAGALSLRGIALAAAAGRVGDAFETNRITGNRRGLRAKAQAFLEERLDFRHLVGSHGLERSIAPMRLMVSSFEIDESPAMHRSCLPPSFEERSPTRA